MPYSALKYINNILYHGFIWRQKCAIISGISNFEILIFPQKIKIFNLWKIILKNQNLRHICISYKHFYFENIKLMYLAGSTIYALDIQVTLRLCAVTQGSAVTQRQIICILLMIGSLSSMFSARKPRC